MPYITVRSLLQRIIRQRRINFSLGGTVNGNSEPTEGEHGETRNLIKLNRSLEQYFTLAPSAGTQRAEASSTYEYEIEFCTTGASNIFQGIIGPKFTAGFGSLEIDYAVLAIRLGSALRSQSGLITIGAFHKLNVKYNSGNVVITLDGTSVISGNSSRTTIHQRIGTFDTNNDRDYYFEGYIKDINYISGFTNNKLIKLDETLQDSSDISFSDGTLVGSMVNGGSAYSEPFTLNTRVTPHVWNNADESVQLPVFGTVSTIPEGAHGYQRNLIKLNRSVAQYFTFTEQTASGDFEWSLDFYSYGSTGVSKALLGNATNDHLWQVWLNNNENITIKTSSQYHHITSSSLSNSFHTLNVKLTGTSLVVKLDDAVILSTTSNSSAKYSFIGNGILHSTNARFFNGYIKDVRLISGFPENKLFKLDEDLVSSNAITDFNGGSDGAMVNGGSAYSERFTLDTGPTPHVYSNDDGSIVLPISGTVGTDPIPLEGEHGYQRNIIKLNPYLEQYFTFDHQTASGDFEFQLDFCPLISNTGLGILGKISSTSSSELGRVHTYNETLYFNTPNVNSIGSVENDAFNTINIKRLNNTITVKINGVVSATITDGELSLSYDKIGVIYSVNLFDGYIKNVHLISGFSENKFFKLDEDLIGSSAIIDSNGGSAGVMVNGGAAYSEPFTLNTRVTPHVWSNADKSVQLPVFGTVSTALAGEHGYQRNLIRLNVGLEQYIRPPQTVFTGDFEYEIDYFLIDSSNQLRGIIGNDTTTRGWLSVKQDGEFTYRTGNSSYPTGFLRNTPSSNIFGSFNTVNVKCVNSVVTVKINDVFMGSIAQGTGDPYVTTLGVVGGYMYFGGYIKDYRQIVGGTQFFKLDEDLVGSNAIVDSNGGPNGDIVNSGSAYSERFTLNTSVSPNVYVNDDASITLPIAGT